MENAASRGLAFLKGRWDTDRLVIAPGAFRLLLAVVVVISHLTRLDVGRLAVLLFFFLSGFWVTRIWQQRFAARSMRAFYGSRAFRIFPLYLVTLLVLAVTSSGDVGLRHLLLLGVASRDDDPTGVSWSLDVELQFYLLMPLLIGIATGIHARAFFVFVMIASAIAWALASRSSVVTVLQYLPAFLLGVLAMHHRYRPSAVASSWSLLAFVTLTAIIFLLPATATFVDKRLADPFDRDLFSFLWMLPLLPYVCRSLARRSSPIDRHLGNLSFPLYLVHYPIIAALKADGLTGREKIFAIGDSAVLAALLYVAIDRPLERLRTRLFERSGAADPPAPASPPR